MYIKILLFSVMSWIVYITKLKFLPELGTYVFGKSSHLKHTHHMSDHLSLFSAQVPDNVYGGSRIWCRSTRKPVLGFF